MKTRKVLLGATTILLVAGCRSAGSAPCAGYARGPRLTSFGVASLPKYNGPLLRADRGAIIGAVADSETARGLARATVTLRLDTAAKVITYARADTVGGFSLSALEPGTYYISARSMTYPERGFRLEVRPGIVDTVRIPLRFNPFYLSCESVLTS